MNIRDWQWLYPNILTKIQNLHHGAANEENDKNKKRRVGFGDTDKKEEQEGEKYNIVLFTNQASISSKKGGDESVCARLSAVAMALNVPLRLYVSCRKDLHRKPSPRFWQLFLSHHGEEDARVEVEIGKSFFVGDAAGRKGDFACTDRMFAFNIGIDFHTPETFFLGKKPSGKACDWSWGPTALPALLSTNLTEETMDVKKFNIKRDQTPPLEVIICVGMPGSGKSSFCKTHIIPNGYVWVNQDTLKSADRCAKEVRTALSAGKNVVVDNTNPSRDHRKMYTRIAHEKGAISRVFYFPTSAGLARHCNIFREIESDGTILRVPDIAYNQYTSQFESPLDDRGIGVAEIVNIPFVLAFDCPEKRGRFYQFTH